MAEFRKHCYIYDLNKKQISQLRLNPIRSSFILERVQMDDHNGELHALWPQRHKEDF